jgi:hypothetical protein
MCYTDYDLDRVDGLNAGTRDSIVWRELLEGYPFYARGSWFSYDTPRIEDHKVVGRKPIRAADVSFRNGCACFVDGRKTFVAKTGGSEPPRILSPTLVWCCLLPDSPLEHGAGRSIDHRLVCAADLPETAF